MNVYFHQFLWNLAMISMIFLMCVFCGLGVERDFKLRKKRPQVIKIKRPWKSFLILKDKERRTRFVTLAVILDFYGYIQLFLFSLINIYAFDQCPEKLEPLGNIVSTLQIGIVLCITFIGYGIMLIQRTFDEK